MDIHMQFKVNEISKNMINYFFVVFQYLDHLSEERLWTRFCDTFRFALDYPRVSYSEFLNVYEALNIAVDQDDDFIHLVNNTWNI